MISDEQLKLDGMLEDAYEHGYQQAKHDYETQVCEDCVSREAVIQALTKLGYGDEENGADAEYMSALCDVAKKVKALQPITPKPKAGKWIDDCPMMTDEGLVRRIRCSVCGDGRKDFYGVSKNYCPNCGAKMEEVNK